MKSALLAFATALRVAPARGFVRVSPGPIQRHQTAKHTHLPPTRRRRDRPSTAIALGSSRNYILRRSAAADRRRIASRSSSDRSAPTAPDYFAASIKFQMWLSVSSLVSFASQILLRDAAAISAGTAGALDRVPLEMGIFGLFCLLNVLELALVPTTFLNLGLIEVVEDFVERQQSAEGTPDAIDARDN